MSKTKETTFGNVVLGARVFKNGYTGQKIDEPTEGGRNENGQSYNVAWESGSGNDENLKPDDIVETTYYSLKDEPEMRHV